MKRVLLVLAALVVIAAGAIEWVLADYTAPGPAARHGSETVVLIKPGIGLSGIARALGEAGVVERSDVFQVAVRLNGKTAELKAGEYAIPSRASMRDITDILILGRSIQHKLTVAEGLTSRMAFDIVRSDPVLVGDPGTVPAEGALLPETYVFTRGESRAHMIEIMEHDRNVLLDKLWRNRATGLPLKNEEEAVILASIVEKESALPEERRHIASVFLNRLRLGMKLQSDPTIIYGITQGYPLGRGIRQSEIDRPTPYNTYAIAGLPPGPICNPGKDSLEAVLDPENTKDLYFVADGTGGHVFAATADEQAKNVAKWRKIERQQSGAPPTTDDRHKRRR
ncbi:MAG: endolytic transglycosylase MltG [Alphaproteobacteria bacterium]|nr:endolytic transglycosylase MltG [Alphaproteobacteria bacterium]